MTLREYALKYVLVTNSYVKHLSQVVSKKIDKIETPEITGKENYPITGNFFLKKGYKWLW